MSNKDLLQVQPINFEAGFEPLPSDRPIGILTNESIHLSCEDLEELKHNFAQACTPNQSGIKRIILTDNSNLTSITFDDGTPEGIVLYEEDEDDIVFESGPCKPITSGHIPACTLAE